MYVTGSSGLMPNSSDFIDWVSTAAAHSPTATPTPVSTSADRTNIHLSSLFCAPSASRIPISRVLCDTVYEITP